MRTAKKARKTIATSTAEPRRHADWRDGIYDPRKDMLSKPARPGAEDALAVPSVINGCRVSYRRAGGSDA